MLYRSVLFLLDDKENKRFLGDVERVCSIPYQNVSKHHSMHFRVHLKAGFLNLIS